MSYAILVTIKAIDKGLLSIVGLLWTCNFVYYIDQLSFNYDLSPYQILSNAILVTIKAIDKGFLSIVGLLWTCNFVYYISFNYDLSPY